MGPALEPGHPPTPDLIGVNRVEIARRYCTGSSAGCPNLQVTLDQTSLWVSVFS